MKIIILWVALCLPVVLGAQNDDKRDNIWLFGYPPNILSEESGGTGAAPI